MNLSKKIALLFIFAASGIPLFSLSPKKQLIERLAISPEQARQAQNSGTYEYHNILLSSLSEQTNFLVENIQQITQTIKNRKLYKKKQEEIIYALHSAQGLLEQIRSKTNNEVTEKSLVEFAHIIKITADYIAENLQQNFKRTSPQHFAQNIQELYAPIAENSEQYFSSIPRITQSSAERIITIHQQSTSLGLTWYNKTFRSLESSWINRYIPASAKSAFKMTILPLFMLKVIAYAGRLSQTQRVIGQRTEEYDSSMSWQKEIKEQKNQPVSNTSSQKTGMLNKEVQPTNQEHNSVEEKQEIDVTVSNQPVSKIQKAKDWFTQSSMYDVGKQAYSKVKTAGAYTYNAIDYAAEKSALPAACLFLLDIDFTKSLVNTVVEEYQNKYTSIQKTIRNIKNKTAALLRGSDYKDNTGIDGFQGIELVNFDELINPPHGADSVIKEYVEYLKNIQRAELSNTAPSQKNILLTGPPQTGKTLFFRAFYTKVKEVLPKSIAIPLTNEILQAHRYSLSTIFEKIKMIATPSSPVLVFIDEIDMLGGGANRDKNPLITQELLTSLQGAGTNTHKPIIVIGATNCGEKLDRALRKDGRFGKEIVFTLPDLESRYKFLQQNLQKRCLVFPEEHIMEIAKQTIGSTFNELNTIVTEGIRKAKRDARGVKMEDFEYALDVYVRHIEKHNHIGTHDHKATATYRAAQAVAHHMLKPHTNIAKVTTYPVQKNKVIKDSLVNLNNQAHEEDVEFAKDPYFYGKIFTYHEIDDYYTKSKKQIESEIMVLLAGRIGQELLDNDYSPDICKDDEKEIIKLAYQLLPATKQNLKEKDKVAYVEAIIEKLEQETRNILEKEKALLVVVQKTLVDSYEITKDMWQEIIKNQ